MKYINFNALCSFIVVLTYLRSILQVIFFHMNYIVTSVYIAIIDWSLLVNHVKKYREFGLIWFDLKSEYSINMNNLCYDAVDLKKKTLKLSKNFLLGRLFLHKIRATMIGHFIYLFHTIYFIKISKYLTGLAS